jgi:D-alanine-D-alanine ligase
VLLACHQELVPPPSVAGLSESEIAEWRTEADVASALTALGHELLVVGVGDEIELLHRAIDEFRPHVVFNLLVEFLGAASYDQHIPSYLELLRVPYTGCNPRGMTLARDKALSKKLLAWHDIPVPAFCVFRLGRRDRRPADVTFPLFVKSLNEEASLGIAQASLVQDDEELAARVAFVHERIGTDAIAEEYIEGRELYLGVLGNERLTAFPPWELTIPSLAPDAPVIATRRVKWDLEYQRQLGVTNARAQGLGRSKERELARIARTSYRALGLSGYARLDLRMRPDGRVYLLEANPNPELARGEDFADGAAALGIEYDELVRRIVELGVAYRAEWRQRGALARRAGATSGAP